MRHPSIPRHGFLADATQEDMAALMESTSRVIGRLEHSEMSRSRALDSTLAVAMSCCAADPQATKLETWEAWVTAMQVGSALFDSAVAAEGPVPCRIGIAGEVKNLPATGPTSYTHAGAWLTAVYLATICRDNEHLDRLMQVPVSFLRASGAVFDEYVYSWVEGPWPSAHRLVWVLLDSAPIGLRGARDQGIFGVEVVGEGLASCGGPV